MRHTIPLNNRISKSNNLTLEAMAPHPRIGTEYFGGLAKLVNCSMHTDERGCLIPFSFDQMPFKPCRSFVVADVPAGVIRGGHAHKSGKQMLVCLQGRIGILMRHQSEEVSFVIEPGPFGLVFGPSVWCQQKYLNEGSVLLVFASEPYDPESYTQDCSSCNKSKTRLLLVTPDQPSEI